jgi:hypothetical protein
MAISTVNQKGLDAPLSLTAPNLGTPSAINLSNATALAKAALPTGSVLQVVQNTYASAFSTSSPTFVDTGLSASITPTSSSSKILVIASQPGFTIYSGGGNAIIPRLLRGATEILRLGQAQNATSTFTAFGINVLYLDSPATTSSTTYKTQIRWSENASGSNTVYLQWASDVAGNSTMILMEIAA